MIGKKYQTKSKSLSGANAVEYGLVLAIIVSMMMAASSAMQQPIESYFRMAGECVRGLVSGGACVSSSDNGVTDRLSPLDDSGLQAANTGLSDNQPTTSLSGFSASGIPTDAITTGISADTTASNGGGSGLPIAAIVPRFSIFGDVVDGVSWTGDKIWSGTKQTGGVFKGFGESAWDDIRDNAAVLADIPRFYIATTPSFNGSGMPVLPNLETEFTQNQEVTEEYRQAGEAIIDDPKGAAYGIVEPIHSDWEDGNYGEAIGRTGYELVSILFPGKYSKVNRARRTANELAQEVRQEIIENTTDEIIEQTTRELEEQIGREIAEGSTKELLEQAREELGEEAVNQIVDDVSQELAEQIAAELLEDSNREIAEQAARELTEESTKDLAATLEAELIKEGLQEDFARELSQNIAEEAGEKLIQELAKSQPDTETG